MSPTPLSNAMVGALPPGTLPPGTPAGQSTRHARALALARWPKRHDHVVEALPMLSVAEVLSSLPADRHPAVWRHPLWPGLVVLTRREGCASRTWLVCPSCRRARGALYRAPEAPDSWRCRGCIGGTGAVYASQRFPRRHPLRHVETPRKAAIRLRRDVRRGRLARRLHRQLPAVPPSWAPIRDAVAATIAGVLLTEPTAADAARLVASGATLIQRLTRLPPQKEIRPSTPSSRPRSRSPRTALKTSGPSRPTPTPAPRR